MGTKNNPDEHDYYAKAMPDEPVFTLTARDRDAPRLIRVWADMRRARWINGDIPKGEHAQVASAYVVAMQMERWRAENNGVWREDRRQTELDIPAPPAVVVP